MKIKESTERHTENFEKYQTLINNLSVGVYRNTPGPHGHFLEANPAIISMFEADSKEELMKHDVSDLYQNPETRKLFTKKLIKYGFVKNEILNLVTLKGRKIIASVTAVMKKDKNGAIYFDGIVEDITNKKRMEESLQIAHNQLEIRVIERTNELNARVQELVSARKALTNVLEDLNDEKSKAEKLADELIKFKLALDNVSDHVTITNMEGITVYANRAAERITGYKAEEAVGKKAGSLWKSPMPKEFYQKLWHTIKEEKKIFIGEIQNKRKNGQIYTATISISPVLDAAGNILFFVGLERDITHEKEIDKAKTEFVSMTSHQLRTPLTTISWYTEMILGGDVGPITPTQVKYLDEIYQGNRRMIELVDTLLDVSRIELGTFLIDSKPTNIITLTKNILDEQKPEIEKKKLAVIEKFNKDIPIFSVDPKLLRMVFQNLLNNAVKYTPEGGKIELGISFENKDNILLTVSDTGYGIPKEQQDKIFTKLFRADNIVEKVPTGTGLGLYITKSIVKNFGGKIWFESEENKGSIFYVSIPLDGMKKTKNAG